MKKEIEEITMQNELLLECCNALMKALPLMRFDNELIKTSEDKKEIINKACEGAALLLRSSFHMCNLKTHIETTVIFDELGESYKLSFVKI